MIFLPEPAVSLLHLIHHAINFKYVCESQLFQRTKDLFCCNLRGKLPDKHRWQQCYSCLVTENLAKIILFNNDGRDRTGLVTFPTINTSLFKDISQPIPDPDGLGWTGFHTMSASDAQLWHYFKCMMKNRMFIFLCQSDNLLIISTAVPSPGTLSILNVSLFFLIFAKPIPAPNPISLTSLDAVL